MKIFRRLGRKRVDPGSSSVGAKPENNATTTRPHSANTGAPPSYPGPKTSASAPNMLAADIQALLHEMAKQSPSRMSIVDLMKLVGMDSSLAARQELARQLNYPGNTSDAAGMNRWLHKQVMQKVAENEAPKDLKR